MCLCHSCSSANLLSLSLYKLSLSTHLPSGLNFSARKWHVLADIVGDESFPIFISGSFYKVSWGDEKSGGVRREKSQRGT